MTVRIATPVDRKAVDHILARSYPKLLANAYTPQILQEALPVMIKAQPALLESGTYYVWEDEQGAILGAGGWSVDKTNPQKGHIRHLVCDPDATGKGVARAVIAECLAKAQAAGLTQMECWATLNAEGFYQRMGFETIGPMDVLLDGRVSFPSLRMMRPL